MSGLLVEVLFSRQLGIAVLNLLCQVNVNVQQYMYSDARRCIDRLVDSTMAAAVDNIDG